MSYLYEVIMHALEWCRFNDLGWRWPTWTSLLLYRNETKSR